MSKKTRDHSTEHEGAIFGDLPSVPDDPPPPAPEPEVESERAPTVREGSAQDPQHGTQARHRTARTGTRSAQSASPTTLLIALVFGTAVAIGGGFVCGILIDTFGAFGALGLWPLGWLGGLALRKVIVEPSKAAAWLLIGGLAVAAVVAETYWIRYNIKAGESGWWASMQYLPRFAGRYKRDVLIGSIAAAFGMYSAYTTVGVRYRMVAVVEE